MSATAESTLPLSLDQLSSKETAPRNAATESPRQLTGSRPRSEAVAAIVFPEGLVGCPEWQRFVQVVDADDTLPVAILQCLDDTAVQLLVTDPALVEPDYVAPLSRRDRAELGLSSGAEPVVYCTLSVHADGSISANLLGPLVVNPVTRRGLQLVLADSTYSTRHPVAHMPLGEGQA